MNIESENKQKSDLPLGWKKTEIVGSILASIALPLIGSCWIVDQP
jgi:Co/Zn/Cd efflux system component